MTTDDCAVYSDFDNPELSDLGVRLQLLSEDDMNGVEVDRTGQTDPDDESVTWVMTKLPVTLLRHPDGFMLMQVIEVDDDRMFDVVVERYHLNGERHAANAEG